MNAKRKREPLPPPDTTGVGSTMARRLQGVGTNPLAQTSPTPTQTSPTGRVRAAHTRPVGQARRGTRPDAEGMTRQSYYLSRDAAEALEAAVETVLAVLGPDTPRHVAISAIVSDGAARAETIAAALAEEQADALAARIAALRRT